VSTHHLFLGRLLLLGLLLSLGLLSRLLEDTLDDLLLLNKESTDDLLLDRVGRNGTTVSTVNGLLGLGDVGVLAGSQGSNTRKRDTGVSALGAGTVLLDVVVTEVATRGLDDLDLVRSRVVYENKLLAAGNKQKKKIDVNKREFGLFKFFSFSIIDGAGRKKSTQ
jgi:hypothetical protein